MAIQGAINRLIGTAGAAVTIADKLGNKNVKVPSDPSSPSSEKEGIDAKMALKARRVAQQKINAIYANKELSNKAKTRRMGQIMDEYSKTLGGKE